MRGGSRRRSARPRPGGWREGALLKALLPALLCLAPVSARAQSLDSLTLHWTAPVDPPGGAVSLYDARFSTFTITAANFAACSPIPAPVPAAPGMPDSLRVRGLVHGQAYWFAIRSRDAAGNWSDLSNVARWGGGLDTAPPAAPAGLSASVTSDGKVVQLEWQANTEPDLRGYFVYRAADPSGPWTRLEDTPLTVAGYTDRQLPAGSSRLWYALGAVDVTGNESARSAAVVAVLGTPLAGWPAAWKLLAPYPNPAPAGTAMRLNIEVPIGADAGRLEIVDAASQIVRRFDVHAGTAGLAVIEWDGSNDRGARCAPGVYRACLIAGDVRQFVRIARVP